MPRVTVPFDGTPDGEVHPRAFVIGDLVHGDLARVAIAEGWAVDVDALQSIPAETTLIARGVWVWLKRKIAALCAALAQLRANVER